VQGVIKAYDPGTGVGSIISDAADLTEYDLSEDALAGSLFRTLRQGQRVVFDLDGSGRATGVRMGSEVDLGTPDQLQEQ
jgi:CspA family cold shock protein